ncbi:MAG: hydroxyacylglutathione hydrolase [Alphaproteobacteria bacterium]|nr:hydroxyacylglutathione hydrolase [Alphaproteobacteria bacterium]
MRIITISCLTDNYAYLIAAGGACAVVDPSEVGPVRAALSREGLTLTHIVNTHHHGDHTGGNLELKREFGATVVGPARENGRIPGLDVAVSEASGWNFAGHDVAILDVPGHTLGATTYVIAGNAFTGDTLFSCGCGRVLEGDPAMMWASLEKLMGLPDDTKLWCGHEYTEKNAAFALTLEPENQALRMFAQVVRQARAKGTPSMPSTMKLEKSVNPFLRPQDAAIRKALGMADARDAEVFAEVRRRKDVY